MKYSSILLCILLLIASAMTVGCQNKEKASETQLETTARSEDSQTVVTPSEDIKELEEGLSVVSYNGNEGFEEFLEQGGASTEAEVVEYLTNNLVSEAVGIHALTNLFGCSTLSAAGADGGRLFGRNFDWKNCDALIVSLRPNNAYQSISTVNLDFINNGAGGMIDQIPDKVKTLAAIYAPLDGMNEKGLAVSVNMIQDSDRIEQNTEKPDITTTTAIRLLLNEAATVDEALGLLEQYDLHVSMGMMVHFAMADRSGRSVAVEYINNEMMVTDTLAVTNFYLTDGDKHGIGTEQSHERYNILMGLLEENKTFTMEQMRDSLDAVSKDNFDEFKSTEWSIVFNQSTGEARYYHREDYSNSYVLKMVLNKNDSDTDIK